MITEKFPFLSIVEHVNETYIGIIQHCDQNFLSMYVIDNKFTSQMKKDFLDMGEIYWWSSNRMIPINLLLPEFNQFKDFLKSFASKDAKIIEGPSVNIHDLCDKRIKRRMVQIKN